MHIVLCLSAVVADYRSQNQCRFSGADLFHRTCVHGKVGHVVGHFEPAHECVCVLVGLNVWLVCCVAARGMRCP
jgi:hypothetical protein